MADESILDGQTDATPDVTPAAPQEAAPEATTDASPADDDLWGVETNETSDDQNTVVDDDDDTPLLDDGLKDDSSPAATTDADLTEADLTLAAQFGITREDAARLGRTSLVNIVGRMIAAREQQQPAALQQEPADAQIPAGQQQKDADDFKLTLDEMYDDGLKANLEGLHQYAKKQINQVRSEYEQRIGMLEQMVMSQAQQAFQSQFDASIANLQEPIRELLGESASLNTEQQRHREAVQKHMQALAMGYEAMNEPVPPMPVLLQQATAALFSDHTQANVRKELVSKVTKAGRRLSPRPTRRKASGGTPEERAVAAIKALES